MVSNPIELPDRRVTNFKKSILPPVGGPEVGREEFFKNVFCLVLVCLPFVMGVNVEIQEPQTISARREVTDLSVVAVSLKKNGIMIMIHKQYYKIILNELMLFLI